MSIQYMEIKISQRLSYLVDKFDIGNFIRYEKIENGLINDSYKVETEKGIFVFQRLSSLWNEKVIGDYCEVQRYLRTNGVFVPVLLHSSTGNSFLKESDGLWRTFEYIQHDEVITPSPEIAYEAGAMLGKFHSLMAKSSFKPSFTLAGYHNTPKILDDLVKTAVRLEYGDKLLLVGKEVDLLSKKLPQYYLPRNHEKIVIHGDPKLLNFLFKNNSATALLDLDTMMEASPLIDIGDALRSWCRRKPATSEFMPEIFEEAVKGYSSTSPFQYCISGIKNAMGLITLELAARYLTDYFNESYFGFNKEKYATLAEQNITRCRRYIDYYNNFMAHKIPYHHDE